MTLLDLKNRVFQAAKDNYVDPIMLPLLQPHMTVLYNVNGKQIGRVEDHEAMEKWIAAHPPPTKKLSAAERAAIPPPPPMPTIESLSALVSKEFGVVPGATIYVGIRVAAQEVVGSDAHENVTANKPVVVPPVDPKDLKKRQKQQQQQQQSVIKGDKSNTTNNISVTTPNNNTGSSPSPGSRRR